jgi:spore maturation protein CgeB
MRKKLTIAFFGSSLVSAYWNGAATYYRGVIKALHARGHAVSFFEPDAFERQKHRDMDECGYARSIVYPANETAAREALEGARKADVVIKASGVGVLDEMLENAVLDLKRANNAILYLDVDAPATLERIGGNPRDPLRPLIARYDGIVTYGGGAPVAEAYGALGAKACVPVYNALDPDTHFPVAPQPKYRAHLSFLGNRMPDREKRVHEFFFAAARLLPRYRFLLGGSGWESGAPDQSNVEYLGHVYTRDHNGFNSSALAVLNIDRDSMARFGFSPPTRIFEAAGAGACIITDAWEGIELFLAPGRECLVAGGGEEVAEHLKMLTDRRAREIGRCARARILAEHTYARRAEQVEAVFYATLGLGGREKHERTGF